MRNMALASAAALIAGSGMISGVAAGENVAADHGSTETLQLPRCAKPVGTVALLHGGVDRFGEMWPHSPPERAQQEKGSLSGTVAPVDAISILDAIIARSGCFRVVGQEGRTAMSRRKGPEANGGNSAPLASASAGSVPDYTLTVVVVGENEYSVRAPASFGNPNGVPQVSSEDFSTRAALTLVAARSNSSAGVATGLARRSDPADRFAGVSSLGIGSTDVSSSGEIATIEAAALVDAFSKLLPQLEAVRERRISVDFVTLEGVRENGSD